MEEEEGGQMLQVQPMLMAEDTLVMAEEEEEMELGMVVGIMGELEQGVILVDEPIPTVELVSEMLHLQVVEEEVLDGILQRTDNLVEVV